jgi:hypothetical protein
MMAGAFSEEGFPDHFMKESPRVEMVAGGEVFEGAWESAASLEGVIGFKVCHAVGTPIHTPALNKTQRRESKFAGVRQFRRRLEKGRNRGRTELKFKKSKRSDGMKKLVLTAMAATLLFASAPSAVAGDREWATAGKILTGVTAGLLLSKAFEPAPVVYHPAPVVYVSRPVIVAPPRPIVVAAPRPVVVAPPVRIVGHPVRVAGSPVYVSRPVVHVPHRPHVRLHVGAGRRHCGPPVCRVCR